MAPRKKKADTDALGHLHNTIAEQLTAKIENGEWDAATMGAAIRFLKDNNITAIPAKDTPLRKLLDELDPEHVSDEDYERIKKECSGNA